MEWFACTLREQPEFSWTVDELEEQLVADAEEVRLAYERMAIDSTPGQKWAKSTLYEADFVAGLLAEHFPTTASILDFGCGPGRHCLELARRGHDVVGVDYVEPYIHQARRLAADEQLAARFMAGDCRTIDLGAQFDVGLCLYDVIGTFPTLDPLHLRIVERPQRGHRGHLAPRDVDLPGPLSRYAWSTGSPASIIASPTAPPSVNPYDAART
jgi:SAM-dependent methyltransferase